MRVLQAGAKSGPIPMNPAPEGFLHSIKIDTVQDKKKSHNTFMD
jgi:hypothetical protein